MLLPRLPDFTKRQWMTIITFSVADFCNAICVSLQAPFYPHEAEAKGASASEYGLVFGIFELVVFIVSPLYGQHAAGQGERPRPVHRAVLYHPDHRGDGQRGVPHRVLRHHRQRVPGQRRHHLRLARDLLRPGADRGADGRRRPLRGRRLHHPVRRDGLHAVPRRHSHHVRATGPRGRPPGSQRQFWRPAAHRAHPRCATGHVQHRGDVDEHRLPAGDAGAAPAALRPVARRPGPHVRHQRRHVRAHCALLRLAVRPARAAQDRDGVRLPRHRRRLQPGRAGALFPHGHGAAGDHPGAGVPRAGHSRAAGGELHGRAADVRGARLPQRPGDVRAGVGAVDVHVRAGRLHRALRRRLPLRLARLPQRHHVRRRPQHLRGPPGGGLPHRVTAQARAVQAGGGGHGGGGGGDGGGGGAPGAVVPRQERVARRAHRAAAGHARHHRAQQLQEPPRHVAHEGLGRRLCGALQLQLRQRGGDAWAARHARMSAARRGRFRRPLRAVGRRGGDGRLWGSRTDGRSGVTTTSGGQFGRQFNRRGSIRTVSEFSDYFPSPCTYVTSFYSLPRSKQVMPKSILERIVSCDVNRLLFCAGGCEFL